MQKTWIVRSQIIVGRTPGKPLEVKLSDNPHKANRIIGSLLDGTEVSVSLRQGRGGVPINKLSTGKIFAVAADSFTPLYEKENGKATNKQKVAQDGSLEFTTGACYLLSTSEYKTLLLGVYYTYVAPGGEEVVLVSDDAICSREQVTLKNRQDITALLQTMVAWLDPQFHWMASHVEGINKLKARKIRHAVEQAEDESQTYDGIQPQDLLADPRDGGPVLLMDARDQANPSRGAFTVIRSSLEEINQMSGQITHKTVSAKERVAAFKASPLFKRIVQAVDSGRTMVVSYTNATAFRTSVSTKKKFANAIEGQSNNGDSFYCNHAQDRWTNSIVGVMYSMHPHFPKADYETNHFVATVRQSELAMTKPSDAWRPFTIPSYDIPASLYSGDVVAIPLVPNQQSAPHRA